MKLARVTGHTTGTIKDSQLAGQKWLIVDIIDAGGTVSGEPRSWRSTCAAPGSAKPYWLRQGSAARLPQDTSGVPDRCDRGRDRR